MKIVTGYKGEPHITSAQDRAWHQGIFGTGSYVLNIGQKLAGEIATANEIRIMDGAISHQGCIAVIGHGTYDTLEIANGEQGKKRIDLVVARYSIDTETGEENLDLVVIEGTSTTGTPAAPAFTTGNIQAGDSPVDMPLYNVNIDGIAIESLTPRFATIGTRVDTNNSVTDMGNTKVSKTGDVMTGTLSQRANNLDTSVTPTATAYYTAISLLDKNNKKMGTVSAYIDSTDAMGAYIEGARDINGSVKLNALRLLLDNAGNCKVVLGGTNAAAAWRSAINAVNKSGDTMTGTLNIQGSQLNTNYKSTDMDSDIGKTIPASGAKAFGGMYVNDKNGTNNGWVRVYKSASDNLYWEMIIRRNTSGSDMISNTLQIGINSSGNRYVSVSDAGVWRTALGTPPTSHASSATTYGLGTTANYGHVKTVNNVTTSSHTDGLALSAYQGYVLQRQHETKKVGVEVTLPAIPKLSNQTLTYTIPSGTINTNDYNIIGVVGYNINGWETFLSRVQVSGSTLTYRIVNWTANTDIAAGRKAYFDILVKHK